MLTHRRSPKTVINSWYPYKLYFVRTQKNKTSFLDNKPIKIKLSDKVKVEVEINVIGELFVFNDRGHDKGIFEVTVHRVKLLENKSFFDLSLQLSGDFGSIRTPSNPEIP